MAVSMRNNQKALRGPRSTTLLRILLYKILLVILEQPQAKRCTNAPLKPFLQLWQLHFSICNNLGAKHTHRQRNDARFLFASELHLESAFLFVFSFKEKYVHCLCHGSSMEPSSYAQSPAVLRSLPRSTRLVMQSAEILQAQQAKKASIEKEED